WVKLHGGSCVKYRNERAGKSPTDPGLLPGDLPDAPACPTDAPAQLILFTRYPVPGRVKTRLIPKLGAEGAARLQRRLTLRSLRCAEALQGTRPVALQVHFNGGTVAQVQHWLGDRLHIESQSEGDLGQRLVSAFDRSFNSGSQATVVIGSDCPGLTPAILEEAFARLSDYPVVLGPATDGGYYLV